MHRHNHRRHTTTTITPPHPTRTNPWPATQLDERSAAVWQSAVGCTLHLTTSAGYWVRAAAAGLPPPALRGLLRACLAFDWAPELHAHFAQLAPLLLCPEEGGGGGAGEPRPTAGDAAGGGRLHGRRDAAATGDGAAVGGGLGSIDPERLAGFGGSEEVLHHFCRAASPEAQRCLLLPLLAECMPPGGWQVGAV
jgi:hypothetical protein